MTLYFIFLNLWCTCLVGMIFYKSNGVCIPASKIKYTLEEGVHRLVIKKSGLFTRMSSDELERVC